MNQTIEYYNRHAEEFCQSTVNADMSFCQSKFLSYLQSGAKLLDIGCGSGRDSKFFIEAGYEVTAMDASKALCLEAEKLLKQKVDCQTFEELSYQNEFDGIWACASLLHVAKAHMPKVLLRLHKALKTDGVIYASFKYGDGEAIVKDRFFNHYREQTLKELLEENGFDIQEIFLTEDVRIDRKGERWVNALARRS